MGSAIVTTFVIALSLAMDAFAVSIVDGLSLKGLTKPKACFIALAFGLFQGLLPLLGHLLGTTFMSYIEEFDHWIAFALLLLIGGKMIFDGGKEAWEKRKGKEEEEERPFTFRLVLLQALATAIDAFAVGITLESSIAPFNVWLGLLLIALVTFLLCLLGVFLGKGISRFLKGHVEIAEILGGIVLMLVGLKILLDHLGVLPF